MLLVEEEKDVQDLLKTTFKKYKDAKIYTPLNEDVFTKGDQASIFRFQDLYEKQQPVLLEKLALDDKVKAQDMPSQADFAQYAIEIKAKQEKEQRRLALAGGGGAAAQPGAGGHAPVAGGGGGTMSEEEEKLRMTLTFSRAKTTSCYVSSASLDDRTAEVKVTKSAAELVQDMWYAQVALWLEEDIFGALGALNRKVAKDLPVEAQWVAYLPVKRLIQFTMGNYVGPAAGAAPAVPGMGMAPAPVAAGAGPGGDLLVAGSSAVFTQRSSTPSVDVLRFQLRLVIDARRLLEVLEAISAAGFYTVLNVDFQEVVPQPGDYYIYGTGPIIEVVVLCEACFLRGSYDKWMPTTVQAAIAAGRAGGMAKGGAGGSRPPDMRAPGRFPMPRTPGAAE